MQIGSFEVPEVRLYPECVQLVKTIYDAIGAEGISSLDLAKMLGYATNTTMTFYRRLNSLVVYGLIEKRGKNYVSELGKNLAYPENETVRKRLMKQAVLNVPLWLELYRKFGKNPPEENFWVALKTITGVESPIAQKHQNIIRKWYSEDATQISEDLTDAEAQQSPQSLSSTSGNNTTKPMMSSPQSVASEDLETFTVGKIVIQLPKADLKKSWEKAKRMMDIYLEDMNNSTPSESVETPNQSAN